MTTPKSSLDLESKPFKLADRPSVFLLKWGLAFSTLVILSLIILPTKPNLSFVMQTSTFFWESGGWFLLSLLSGLGLYYSSFPQYQSSGFKYVCFGVIAALVTFYAVQTYSEKSLDLASEFDLWRGRCGFLILGMSLIFSTFLGHWSRKLAPPSALATGAFAGMSASALGCLMMQFICLHDMASHKLFWHMAPLFLISTGAALLGRRFLRW